MITVSKDHAVEARELDGLVTMQSSASDTNLAPQDSCATDDWRSLIWAAVILVERLPLSYYFPSSRTESKILTGGEKKEE